MPPVVLDVISSRLNLPHSEVEASVRDRKFDESYAFYHILGRRTNSDVSRLISLPKVSPSDEKIKMTHVTDK